MLSDLQREFSLAMVRLLVFAATEAPKRGLAFRLEEFYRHPSATHGHKRSVHRSKLAGHIILDRWNPKTQKYVYVRDSESYAWLGEEWKRLHLLARWGGDFKGRSADGNHFSFQYGGVK